MSNTTDFVPFEWDHAQFSPIRLAFSALERDLNMLLENEFTWSVFVTPVLVVLTTFLLAFSIMDVVFVLHGAISIAAFTLVRLKQITGHLLSRLTSVTRFLFQLSGVIFGVSTIGVLSGPFYRFSQMCNEQLTVILSEVVSDLTIFANDHVLPFLETTMEAINISLSHMSIAIREFAGESFELILEISSETWNKFDLILGEVGQAITRKFAQISFYTQETLPETKLILNGNENEIDFEILGACLVLFTVLSCAFKFLARKPSSSKKIEKKAVSLVESTISAEEVSQPTTVESSPKQADQVQENDLQITSTPLKSPVQQRVAVTPFMTPISVISAVSKDQSDDELENENENHETALEFSECMTSIKPVQSQEQKTQEAISVIDLSLEEDDDENDGLPIHSPSPLARSRSIQTTTTEQVDENMVDSPTTVVMLPRLTPNQAKIGLMVTVLGDNQRGRKLRRGGVGKITMIHDNGTVDVKFMIERGQETRVPMENILVGSHPNAIGIVSKASELKEDGYLLRPARDSLATRRRLSALADLSNLSDNSAVSAVSSKSASAAPVTSTTTAKKPLYRAQRTSDVTAVNATFDSGGVTTRASLRTRRASLE